jgi:poly(A) polymerase
MVEETRAPLSITQLLEDGSVVMRLAEGFVASGHPLYLVGGSVRDLARGSWVHTDLDFSTGASPEEIKEIVRPWAAEMWLQGERYGTVGALIGGIRCEITTFRTERYQPSSRHPDIAFAADIETDLSRRDFTINAMALSLPDQQLIDPFGGVTDMKRGVLATPTEPLDSFSDDPLRMLRAFRFVSQLDVAIAPEVADAIVSLSSSLETVSAERIRDELSRLVKGVASGNALRAADETGVLRLILPELSELKLEQDPIHKHKDVFEHTLAVLERTDADSLTLRLAAMLHDIGKPRTRRIDDEGVSFHHHEVVGADMAARRLRALRYPNLVVKEVSELIRLHHRFHTYRLGWSDSAVRRYVRDAGPLLRDLNRLVRADCTTRNTSKAKRLAERMDELEARIRDLAAKEELSRIRPQLDGRAVMEHLGLQPGPKVGEALEFLMEIRMSEGEIDEDEAYRRLDEWAAAGGPASDD